MELLSSINNSGIGAQYAISAAKDVNGNEITSTYLTAVPEGYATESFVTSQGYITGSYLTADALDNVSGTWNTVTNKLDSTAFSTVSGNFLTAHQSLPSSANWNSTYNTVTGNSAKWNDTYDTVHDNSASWTGGGASVTSPRGTININGDEIEGTNSAVLTGTAGGYSISMYADDNHIEDFPATLTYDTLPDTAQTGGTLVISLQGSDPSLYITVTGTTFGGGTATASGQGSAGGSNLVYIPLGEMKGPFTAQSTYWVNLNSMVLTASGDPTTGIVGVGELAWNSALDSIRNTSATWNNTTDTVYSNSASWGAGSTYTGDAQGALDEVYSKSGDWNTVTDKLNSTAFSTVSGSFLTAHQALPNSGNWDSTYTTVSNNSASWGAGSTYTGDAQGALDEVYTNSSNWNSTYTTVHNNSASWTGGGGGGVVTSTAGANGYVTAINGSGFSGASASVDFDVYGISAGEGITLTESASALWINAAGGGESRVRLYYDPAGTATARELPTAPSYPSVDCYYLNESPMNFERLEIYTGPHRTATQDGKNIGNGFNSVLTETITGGRIPVSASGTITVTSTFVASVTGALPKYYISNGTLYGCSGQYWWWRETPKNWQCGATAVVTDNTFLRIYEVVGVNRTASN